MNKQEQEWLFMHMSELNEMLMDLELDVRTAVGYSLEYQIQQLGYLICSVRDKLVDYFEHGIEEEEDNE